MASIKKYAEKLSSTFLRIIILRTDFLNKYTNLFATFIMVPEQIYMRGARARRNISVHTSQRRFIPTQLSTKVPLNSHSWKFKKPKRGMSGGFKGRRFMRASRRRDLCKTDASRVKVESGKRYVYTVRQENFPTN